MKILQLGKFYPVRGGIEKVMVDISMGMSDRGITSDILCASLNTSIGRVKVLTENCRIYLTPALAKVSSTMISPSMIPRLRKICHNYEIVDIHHPDPMAALSLRLSGYEGAVVLHWHSDILRQRMTQRLYGPLLNWILKRADIIVVTTPVYLDNSRWLKSVAPKCRIIPIGVRPMTGKSDVVRSIQNRYGDRRIVFSLGRLVGYKGLDYLIRASAMLPDNYVTLIGGTGPLRDSLNDEIIRLGLSEKVILLGYIPAEELGNYYCAARVFCLPSITRAEAFGIVQIEAMSCGTPVVATRIDGSGVSWVNRHGESGLNVSPCNPVELADAIMRISEDTRRYTDYSEGAYRRYRGYFDEKTMTDSYVRLYSELIGKV